MHRKTSRHKTERRTVDLQHPLHTSLPVTPRSNPQPFCEQAGKSSDAFKAHGKASIGYRHARGEMFRRFLKPHLHEILMRRFVVNALEQPDEMKPRESSLAGDVRQVDALIIMCIDE